MAIKAVNTALARARGMVGHGVYRLGAGGMNPGAGAPFSLSGLCDCSGFLAWCMGVSRKTDHPLYEQWNGGWLETSAIVRDIEMLSTGMFLRVREDVVQPGDVAVWGDRGKRQGHVGIVSAVQSSIDKPRVKRVIHCSKGNERIFGCAVAETNADLFYANKAIFGRYAGWSR